MKIHISTYIFIALFLAVVPCFGQIETEQVEVIKEFEATLEDAKKESVMPSILVTKQQRKKYKYDVTIQPLELKYPDPIIKPLSMKGDDPFRSESFYLKGGFGNLKNPFASLRFAKAKNDKLEFNVFGDYHAVDNSAKVAFQKMSALNAGVDVKARMAENVMLKVNGTTNLDKRFLYFTLVDPNLTNPDAIKRNTYEFNGKVGIQNIESINGKFDYELNAGLTYLNSTNFSANEQILSVDGNGRYRFSNSFYIDFPVQLDLFRYDVIEFADAKANAVISTSPQIVFHKGKFNIKIGPEVLVEKTKTVLWPKAEVAVSVIGNYVQAMVGSDMRSHMNDLKNILAFAPWANTRFSELNVNVGNEVYGGMKGDLGYIAYDARAGYRIGKGQPIFTNYRIKSLESNDRVSIDYIRMTTLFFNGIVDFNVNEKLVVGGNVTKNYYNPEIAGNALGLLGFEAKAYAKLKPWGNKLILRSDLFIADRVETQYPNAIGAPEKRVGTALADLNLGIEIWPIKNVAIYADAYNILNNENMRWYGYPQVGIHFNAGAVIKF